MFLLSFFLSLSIYRCAVQSLPFCQHFRLSILDTNYHHSSKIIIALISSYVGVRGDENEDKLEKAALSDFTPHLLLWLSDLRRQVNTCTYIDTICQELGNNVTKRIHEKLPNLKDPKRSTANKSLS